MNRTSSSAVITKVGVCACMCVCVSSCGRAKVITWPLVPLITSFREREEKEREMSDFHLFWVGPELWQGNSMVVKMWVCFDCAAM